MQILLNQSGQQSLPHFVAGIKIPFVENFNWFSQSIYQSIDMFYILWYCDVLIIC